MTGSKYSCTAKADQEVAPTTTHLYVISRFRGASCEDFRGSETKSSKSLPPLLRVEGPFFGMRVKETGWSVCHAIKDAVRESRHDFMANDSRANIGVGCRGDNQVELS